MIYCPYCGNELSDTANFCTACGGKVTPAQPPMVLADRSCESEAEIRDFVETTHRLLRWERKAWKISGIAFTILGIVFCALFMLFSLIFMGLAGEYHEVYWMLSSVYFIYAIYFLILILPIGIVCLKSADKIPYYLDAIEHNDIAPAVKRCGSVGMLVLAVLFNTIAFVFFIINFVRMKTNEKLINTIIQQQQQM